MKSHFYTLLIGCIFSAFYLVSADDFKPGKAYPKDRNSRTDLSLASFIKQRRFTTDSSLVLLIRGEKHYILNDKARPELLSEPAVNGDVVMLDEAAGSFIRWRRQNPETETSVFWKANPQLLDQALRYPPTSAVNMDTAINTAQSVMVCRLADLGWVDFRGPGVSAYDEAKFDVITTLKGEPIAKIVCSLLILGHSTNATEKAPAVGESYVVMGDSQEGKFTLQKLLAATPDNIAKVRRLLSLPPPSDSARSTTSTPERDLPVAQPMQSSVNPPLSDHPLTQIEQPTSSDLWSIMGVLIVAATGLLWLLFKKRK